MLIFGDQSNQEMKGEEKEWEREGDVQKQEGRNGMLVISEGKREKRGRKRNGWNHRLIYIPHIFDDQFDLICQQNKSEIFFIKFLYMSGKMIL